MFIFSIPRSRANSHGKKQEKAAHVEDEDYLQWMASVPESLWASFTAKPNVDRVSCDAGWTFKIGLSGDHEPIFLKDTDP